MNIILLTHERELLKKTGTGKLVKEVLGESCKIIPWKRVEPSKTITEDIDPKKTVLLYPTDEDIEIDLEDIENFILLDGTWQEAKKIYNRSPYLKEFKKLKLPNTTQSIYKLRKNQKDYGLCTLECVAEIYKLYNDTITNKKLINRLIELQTT